ncbi:MAG: winged helix-turn-helix domain-containing protein [Acidobacteria bacterium]|nr:winged helix-turn-helix domain-containing protein [Acidobacteriota bacterium]
MAGIIYNWGGWTFEPAEWRLAGAAGAPVSLPKRTLDLLAMLLDRAPSLVTKDEILAHVWRGSVVEEGNIAFHIATLRKTLDTGGPSCIETVRGRGYRFAAPVTRHEPVSSPPALSQPVSGPDDALSAPSAAERRAARRRRSRLPVWSTLMLTILIGGIGWISLAHEAPPLRAVTVLPASDGLAELVAARLEQDTSLQTRVGTPGPDGEDPVEAGKRLKAEAILTLSVDRSADPWRVLAEVTRTRDQVRLWSWLFSVSAGEPGVSNAGIAARVAAGLGRHLQLARATGAGRMVNPAAYDLSLQAREQWRQRTPHTVQQAIALYERAIALDPEFARAYAGLADCYNLTMSGLPPGVRYPRALEYAEKAVALDPDDAAGHTSLAFLRYKFEWRWNEADVEFSRAIALDPKYALARHWYGEFLGLMGRYDEAITQLRLAIDLEPQSLAILSDLIPPLLRAGRVAEARAVVEAAATTNPNWAVIPYRMAEVLEAEGRERESVESRWRWMLLSGASLEAVDRLRTGYLEGGLAGMTRAEIAGYLQVEAATPGAWLNATLLSRLYARLGERAPALHWLDVALDRREDAAILLLTSPDYDSLRGEPEFNRQLARLGLTPLAPARVSESRR